MLGDDWFYKDGKLQQIRNHLADAEAERAHRMAEATARIDWLDAAQKDGDISGEEETELAALRAYRTSLRRLDLTTAPDVKWPEYPVA
ncbi:Caudovirales tail fibre assembly protein [Citrobacter freundii]|nr:Caudovirales tail fibre assembly protein [Citrobacter freundii]